MPVIQPWYQSTRELGQPVFLTYWRGFLSERGAYNQKLMQARLEAQDPKHLREMLIQSQKNIAALEEMRAKLQMEDMASRGDVAGMLVRGLGSYITATVNGEARVAEARINSAGRLEEMRLGIEDRARKSVQPGPEVLEDLSAINRRITEEGVAPESSLDVYTSQLADVVDKAREGGDQAQLDGILYAAWRNAEQGGHTAAAAAFAAQLGGAPSGYMQRRYGAVDAAAYDAAVQRAVGAGGLSHQADPIRFFTDVMGAINGPATYPAAPSAGGAASPAAPALSGTGAPAAGGSGGHGPSAPPAAGLLGAMLPPLDLSGVDGALARAKADQDFYFQELQRAREQPYQDGFEINYLTQNSRTRRHPLQDAVDAIAEGKAQNPMAFEGGMDLLARKGGITTSPNRAINQGQGDLAEEHPTPGRIDQIPDGGEFLFAWLGDELREIRQQVAAASTPEEYAAALSRYHTLVEIGEQDLPVLGARQPELFTGLSSASKTAALAKYGAERSAVLVAALEQAEASARSLAYSDQDVHMGELFSEQLATIQAEPDPHKRVEATARLNAATGGLPSTLTGDLSRVLDTRLQGRAATGDLEGLDLDLRDLQKAADRRAAEAYRQKAQINPNRPGVKPPPPAYNATPGEMPVAPGKPGQKEMDIFERALREELQNGSITAAEAAATLTRIRDIEREYARKQAEIEAEAAMPPVPTTQPRPPPLKAPPADHDAHRRR